MPRYGQHSLLNVVPLSIVSILQNFFCFNGADVYHVVVNLVRVWKAIAAIDSVLNASLGKLRDLVSLIITRACAFHELLVKQIAEVVSLPTHFSEIRVEVEDEGD